jgi:hypothetical protein
MTLIIKYFCFCTKVVTIKKKKKLFYIKKNISKNITYVLL